MRERERRELLAAKTEIGLPVALVRESLSWPAERERARETCTLHERERDEREIERDGERERVTRVDS